MQVIRNYLHPRCFFFWTVLCFTFFTSNGFTKVNTYKWSDLILEKKYRINKKIDLYIDHKSALSDPPGVITINKDETVKLKEIRSLPMINVYLAEFKLSKCRNTPSSEMRLIDVFQPDGSLSVVGVNFIKKCKLEVFLETKDYFSNSFFI